MLFIWTHYFVLFKWKYKEVKAFLSTVESNKKLLKRPSKMFQVIVLCQVLRPFFSKAKYDMIVIFAKSRDTFCQVCI